MIEELETMKYKICCPMCDNDKCVKNTEKCEAEIWKKKKMMERDRNDIIDNNTCI